MGKFKREKRLEVGGWGTLMTRIIMIFTDVFGMYDVRCMMLEVGSWMLDVGSWMLEERHPDIGCLPAVRWGAAER